MTQTARVLSELRSGQWVCSSWMYSHGLPNGRNRICELESRGFVIEREPCPDEHDAPYYRYRLTLDPEQVTMFRVAEQPRLIA